MALWGHLRLERGRQGLRQRRRQPGGQGAAQGRFQPLGQLLLQVAGLEGAQIQLQTLQPVPAAGGAEFAEHSLQQEFQGGVMHLAEPIHEAAGEGLLSGADLQLEAMQPVAGRGWGVIPIPPFNEIHQFIQGVASQQPRRGTSRYCLIHQP